MSRRSSDGFSLPLFGNRVVIMSRRHFYWIAKTWYEVGYRNAVADMKRGTAKEIFPEYDEADRR